MIILYLKKKKSGDTFLYHLPLIKSKFEAYFLFCLIFIKPYLLESLYLQSKVVCVFYLRYLRCSFKKFFYITLKLLIYWLNVIAGSLWLQGLKPASNKWPSSLYGTSKELCPHISTWFLCKTLLYSLKFHSVL